MVTMRDTRRIAWSILWKTSLASLVLGFAAGAVFGFIAGVAIAVLGGTKDLVVSVSSIGGGVLGLVLYFLTFNFFLTRAIGKRIGNKQLQLVEFTAFGEKSYAN
ncbi:hypothetical protein FY134_05595 [Agrobacterium fabrum]|uniref:Uncharacterized protein n=1 Tax=Agrobacterium fabrum TaxID=1176649 RepID=A0A7Z7BKL6_9HYPH|nr:hypothetical protein [Agrobacterium fabrum]MDH6294913.1 cation transporter-like permease [Agrobacterium fabrum]UXT57151.1 hypothetical protein FY134_05595 [Agrobacterium fabrum]SDB18166.1 hypothetical protein SAMN03159422_00425 [Agrobacterium fabrum]SDJ35034.1 hypothetical protein SAMN05428983_1274 [Agrobacterium fabrum]SEQ31739.1 hypothetical protein SAMN03159504_00426 [Agrobacterium fabrum]